LLSINGKNDKSEIRTGGEVSFINVLWYWKENHAKH
jgi:hypothetical protein